MTSDEKKAWQQVLDETLRDQLHHYYSEVQKMRGDDMMYDPTGNVAFVTIAFCRPNDVSLLPEDATPSDRKVALGSASSAIMPEIHGNEDGVIGPPETIPHGVQAVAAAMLLSSLQGAMVQIMAASQSMVLKNRSMN